MQVKEEVETKIEKKKVYKYIAFDGKEFDSSRDCQDYEADKTIKKAIKLFNLRDIGYNGTWYKGFTYHKGNDEIFKRMVEICITAEIDLSNKCVDFWRCLDNVQDFRTNKRTYDVFFKDKVWEDGNTYLIDTYHHEYCDDWDSFRVILLDKYGESEYIQKLIKQYEDTFGTSYSAVNINVENCKTLNKE